MFTQYFIRRFSIFFMVAMIVMLKSACFAGEMPDDEDITGVVWKWQQTRYNNDQPSVPADPSRYTIGFNPDGTLNIRSVCHRFGGNYTMERSHLNMDVPSQANHP